AEYFGACGDGVVDVDGRREFAVLTQKDGPGSRHVHGHERVQETGRETALHNESPKLRLRHKSFVEMQRVVVAREPRERRNMVCRQREASLRPLSNRHVHTRPSSNTRSHVIATASSS